MRFLSEGKRVLTDWLWKLEGTEFVKLLVGLIMAAVYVLSATFPAIGQWLLNGSALLIGFTSFASLLLSRAGVSIKKLKPIEELFVKLDDSLKEDKDV